MSIHKRYIKSRDAYKIDFTLPEEITNHARKVSIVGDFNEWHPDKNPMKRDKTGKFKGSVELPAGHDYQFRYLIDKYNWETDWETDGLAETPYSETYNSVIKCSIRMHNPE